MLITELQELEEVKNLVTKGQAVGVVAYGEVAQALAEVDVDEGDIEELYGYLEGAGRRDGRRRRPRAGFVARRRARRAASAASAASRPRST